MEAVRQALAWAREGDLLLLTVHADRDSVLRYLQRLVAEGWTPGAAAPRMSADLGSGFATARDLAAAIRERRLSAVEAYDLHAERILRINPLLNAIVIPT